jgi:hypothetical protein
MISRQGALLLRHVALMGEQVVLADFVGFGDVSGSVMEYVTSHYSGPFLQVYRIHCDAQ